MDNYFLENFQHHPYFRASFEARRASGLFPLSNTKDYQYYGNTNEFEGYGQLDHDDKYFFYYAQQNQEKNSQGSPENLNGELEDIANKIIVQIDKCISTAMKISPELVSNFPEKSNELLISKKYVLAWIEKLRSFHQTHHNYNVDQSSDSSFEHRQFGPKISIDSSNNDRSEDTSPQSPLFDNLSSQRGGNFYHSSNNDNSLIYSDKNQFDYSQIGQEFSGYSDEINEYHMKKRKRDDDKYDNVSSDLTDPMTIEAHDEVVGPENKKIKPVRKSRKPKPHIQVFKVNPSKSVPHSLLLDKNMSGGKVPSSLANTLAGAMMYSFDIRKEKKKQKKRTSSIGKLIPSVNSQLEDFSFLTILGTGTFGKVHLVLHNDTLQYYCMKVLHKKTVYRYKQIEHVQNEKNILSTIQHPGIVKLFGTFQCPDSLYFLMEYIPGGELFHCIRKFGKLPENVVKYYTCELILTLEHMHNQNIVYRDLKPENILLDENGHTKLTDLGFSKYVEDKTWTMCGTPDYLAPEIIMGIGHNTAVDWWSLGILVYEMLAGYPPFTDEVTMKLFEKIKEPEKLVMPEFFSVEAKDFIKKLLVVDPSRRLGTMHPDVCNIKLHPWFNDTNWKNIESRKSSGPLVPVLKSAGDTTNFGPFNDNYHVASIPNHLNISIPRDIEQVFETF